MATRSSAQQIEWTSVLSRPRKGKYSNAEGDTAAETTETGYSWLFTKQYFIGIGVGVAAGILVPFAISYVAKSLK